MFSFGDLIMVSRISVFLCDLSHRQKREANPSINQWFNVENKFCSQKFNLQINGFAFTYICQGFLKDCAGRTTFEIASTYSETCSLYFDKKQNKKHFNSFSDTM